MTELAKTAPTPQEVEIVLQGPGYGEAVLVHAEGDWIAIDSCLDAAKRQPASLAYLSHIGISTNSVSRVIATHWHDDHTRGLAEVFRTSSNAELVISGALQRREFLELIEAYAGWPTEGSRLTSGVDELRLALFEARRRGPPPRFAHQDQIVWRSVSGNSELWSLSPSNQMLLLAFRELASLMPRTASPKRRVSSKSPNHLAVALLLKSGNQIALLGSDLENSSSPHTGWAAVIASSTRPQLKGSLFKVAHHGSLTGDHPQNWTRLLDGGPISIVSPFVLGNVLLPTAADIQRIRTQSRIAGITSVPRLFGYSRRGALGRLTKGKRLRRVEVGFGALRCRAPMTGGAGHWTIEYGGDARQL